LEVSPVAGRAGEFVGCVNLFPVNWRDMITFEPGKCGGKPCIRRMRITVFDVLDYLAGGMTVEEILEDFPYLTREDIRAACAFVSEFGQEQWKKRDTRAS